MLRAAVVPTAWLTIAVLTGGAAVSAQLDPTAAGGVLAMNGTTSLVTLAMIVALRAPSVARHLEAIVAAWSLLITVDLFAVALLSPLQHGIAVSLMPILPLLLALFVPVRPAVQVLHAAACALAIIGLHLTAAQTIPAVDVLMAIVVGPGLSVPGSYLLRRRRMAYVDAMLRARQSSRIATGRGRALDSLYRDQAASARRDPLTGVGNRLRMSEALGDLEGATQPTSMLLVDVDRFKQYNDAHGHPAGDDALRRVAIALSRALRGRDEIFRYGGEEFLVVLPDTDLGRARQVAERLRKVVEGLGRGEGDAEAETGITISIGLAVHRSEVGVTPLRTLASADAALYRAKRAGRNRVEVHPPTITTVASPALAGRVRKVSS
jgi:diguanylate cyclase (GGDEF)-like protein